MALKKLTDFIKEDIEANANGKKPDARTVKKFKGAVKLGECWFMDMDTHRAELRTKQAANDLIDTLMSDQDVANLF